MSSGDFMARREFSLLPRQTEIRPLMSSLRQHGPRRPTQFTTVFAGGRRNEDVGMVSDEAALTENLKWDCNYNASPPCLVFKQQRKKSFIYVLMVVSAWCEEHAQK